MTEKLSKQIDRLAKFIMSEVEGEPSQSQGVVDTAIRIMQTQIAELARLRQDREALLHYAAWWDHHGIVPVGAELHCGAMRRTLGDNIIAQMDSVGSLVVAQGAAALHQPEEQQDE